MKSCSCCCLGTRPMCPMRLKGRHKAQIAYGVIITISALVWAWLQAVERHPLPDVDLGRDDDVHWPVVLIHSCSLDQSVVSLPVPALGGPFEVSVVDSCYDRGHQVALKAADCAVNSLSSNCTAALRDVTTVVSGRSAKLADGLRYHIFTYSSSGVTSPRRPVVLDNLAIVDARDHQFGVEWLYRTVWFPERAASSRESLASALSNPRQQLTFLLVSDAASSARAHWDFGNDVFDAFMRPFVRGFLQQVFDIEMDSQVAHGAVLPRDSRSRQDGGYRMRTTKQLRQLLAEASHWGRPETLRRGYRKLPHTIHLAAYVAPDNMSVTAGAEDKSSVGVPGWGVVAFVPSMTEYGYAAGMWHAHLRAYLGFEPVPSCNEAVGWLCSDPILGLTVPEFFELVREAIIYYRSAARGTLKQLNDLVESLPQVAVSEDIASRATAAAKNIDTDLVMLNDTRRALEMARESYEESVDLLLDDSISARSYFSEEFTLAVYLPVAAPLLIPILVNLLQEFRLWRKSRSRTGQVHEKVD